MQNFSTYLPLIINFIFCRSEDPGLLPAHSTVTVERGQQANLIVHWSSLGDITSLAIRWYKNGAVTPIASFENGDITSNILYESGRRLTINSASMSDAGVYNITGIRYTSGFTNAYQAFITLVVYSKSQQDTM